MHHTTIWRRVHSDQPTPGPVTYAEYWDVPVEQVPEKTGAATVMGLEDIREVLDHFRLDLSDKRVADIGCGTGRLAQVCGEYWGFDIAPGMVAYGQAAGLNVAPLEALASLASVDVVCCLSVFTHITRADRQAYLARFARLAPMVLVDILPGADGGDVAATFSDPRLFESDLADAGFGDFDTYRRTSPDGALHSYYLAWRP